MNSIQKEREAFEAWVGSNGRSIERFSDGSYKSMTLDKEWDAWQAAKSQAVPEWIETAIQPPEEGQKVIISGIYGVGIAEFSYLYKDEFVMYDMGASNPILSKDQVKFWMPLPDAPQEPTND
jgi:hypothetical protein